MSRFIFGTFVLRLYSALFPLGTFLINVTGSFLIGVLMTIFLNRPSLNANWRLFLVTGVLGGYAIGFRAMEGNAPGPTESEFDAQIRTCLVI